MIRCYSDSSIEEDNKCANCCIHCNEKNCEYVCSFLKEKGTEDEREIARKCTYAYEI